MSFGRILFSTKNEKNKKRQKIEKHKSDWFQNVLEHLGDVRLDSYWSSISPKPKTCSRIVRELFENNPRLAPYQPLVIPNVRSLSPNNAKKGISQSKKGESPKQKGGNSTCETTSPRRTNRHFMNIQSTITARV